LLQQLVWARQELNLRPLALSWQHLLSGQLLCDAADPGSDLFARHPVAGQQHDPGPLDHPGRRAFVPDAPLQLSPIGVGHFHHPHMRP
jgi:hypothetical protein